MAARAIQLSLTQVVAGMLIGSTIEALLPKRSEAASVTQQVFEALTHAGLNGAALAVFGELVRGEGLDPTFGIPFAQSLLVSQPVYQERIAALSAIVSQRVNLASRQMVTHVAAA